MKKTILGLTLALTSNVAFSNDAGFKSRVYSVVAGGLDTTKNVLGASYEISRNAVSKVPGSTFVGNHKRALFITASVYAVAELYNWKKGKELFTTRAKNYAASSWLGLQTASAWATVTSWFTRKTAVVKQQFALAEKQVEALNNLDTTTLVNKDELKLQLDAIAQEIKSLGDTHTEYNVFIANTKKAINELNIDYIRKNISDLQIKSVSKDTWLESQKANVEAFATKAELKKLMAKFMELMEKVAGVENLQQQQAPIIVETTGQPEITTTPDDETSGK